MTVQRESQRDRRQAFGVSHTTPTRPDPSKALPPSKEIPTNSHPAEVFTSTPTNQGTEGELADWLAQADRIHALHHHRQAAQHHEREAEWNAKWAEWHRAEAARLEGES